MQWLVIVPLINIGVWLIVGLVALFRSSDHSYKGPPLDIDTYMPDGEQYKNVCQTTKEPNPTIAEQFDGRLTNIFRNPWEGIL